MKRILLALLAFAAFFPANAQTIYYQFFDSIPVSVSGTVLRNAWGGGFNSPQFSPIDLNGDSILDLFVYDRDGEAIKTFINGGTSDVSDYDFAPEYRANFPTNMVHMALLRDYNCDGGPDIFTGGVGGMKVYQQVPDPELGFSYIEVEDLVFSWYDPNWVNLYVASTDIPAIADIDYDGDLDVLSWGVWGNRVEYHKNQSMELYGHCDSLIFHNVTQCYGNFFENASDNSVTLNSPCSEGTVPDRPFSSAAAHTGGTLLSRDLDGDMDHELIIGDISYNEMVMLTNGGDLNISNFSAQDTMFPAYDTPIEISVFPAAFSLDVDNDGIEDLLSAPNAFNATENLENVLFYKNVGTNSVPDYSFQQTRWLSDGMIDVGTSAHPAFVDLNGDNLLDMVVGNYGYYNDNGTFTAQMASYINIGSATQPEFQLQTLNFGLLSGQGLSGIYPTFGDLDGDGDMDMIVGDFDGELHFFENTAGAGNPVNFNLAASEYMGIDVGQTATPQLVDVNQDGKLDLLVGERSGNLNYFENIGTTSAANFDADPTDDFFGGIDTMEDCCTGYSSPFMYEREPGKWDLLVGSEEGKIRIYRNIQFFMAQDEDFIVWRTLDTYSNRVAVTAADLDGDDIVEIAYGEYPGGVGMIKRYIDNSINAGNAPEGPEPPKINGPDTVAGINNAASALPFEVFLAPNPASNQLNVTIEGAGNQQVQVVFTDIAGRQVLSRNFVGVDGKTLNLDLSSLSNGLYFVTVRAGSERQVQRLVKG